MIAVEMHKVKRLCQHIPGSFIAPGLDILPQQHHLTTVCEITFEKCVDTLSGYDKVSMDIDEMVWT